MQGMKSEKRPETVAGLLSRCFVTGTNGPELENYRSSVPPSEYACYIYSGDSTFKCQQSHVCRKGYITCNFLPPPPIVSWKVNTAQHFLNAVFIRSIFLLRYQGERKKYQNSGNLFTEATHTYACCYRFCECNEEFRLSASAKTAQVQTHCSVKSTWTW
jgi:hypothetical protein